MHGRYWQFVIVFLWELLCNNIREVLLEFLNMCWHLKDKTYFNTNVTLFVWWFTIMPFRSNPNRVKCLNTDFELQLFYYKQLWNYSRQTPLLHTELSYCSIEILAHKQWQKRNTRKMTEFHLLFLSSLVTW